MRTYAMIFGVCSILILSPSRILACAKVPDTSISLIGSYEFGAQEILGPAKKTDFSACGRFADQYLVLTSGPVFTNPNFRATSSPEGKFPEDDGCFIENSPFDISNPIEAGFDSHFKRQAEFLSKCLEFEITDLGKGSTLDFSDQPTRPGEPGQPDQVQCVVTSLASNKALARGPRCAFKISKKSKFSVRYRIRPQCLDKSFVEQEKISPMDIKTQIGFYRSESLAPDSPAYLKLGFVNARVTVLPAQDLMPVTRFDGLKTGVWPTVYGAEAAFGTIKVKKLRVKDEQPEGIFLRFPLVVNNNCDNICQGEICTSPCNYYTPIVADFSLAKKSKDGSLLAVDDWIQGNIVPGRFLGKLSLSRKIDDAIRVGETYLLTAKFSAPSATYLDFREEASRPPRRTGGIEFGTITPLDPRESGSITEFPEFGQQTLVNRIKDAIDPLNGVVGVGDIWPPTFSEVRHKDARQAARVTFLTLQTEFTIKSISPSGRVSLADVKLQKDSGVFGSYAKKSVDMSKFPKITCQ